MFCHFPNETINGYCTSHSVTNNVLDGYICRKVLLKLVARPNGLNNRMYLGKRVCLRDVLQTISTVQVLKMVWIEAVSRWHFIHFLLVVASLVSGDIPISRAFVDGLNFDFAWVKTIIIGVLWTLVPVLFLPWSFLLGRFIVNFVSKIKPTN
jgi:hypothetical protein